MKRFFLNKIALTFICHLSICISIKAQSKVTFTNEKKDSIIQVIDALWNEKPPFYDSLYAIKLIGKYRKKDHYYCGWKIRENENEVTLLDLSGIEITVSKSFIENGQAKNVSRIIAQRYPDYFTMGIFRISDFFHKYSGSDDMPYYLLLLWLHDHNQNKAVKTLIETSQDILNTERITSVFGNYYYNEMLVAYSNEKNYSKAIYYGEKFRNPLLKQFQYRKEAISLSEQLKNRNTDFNTFVLPDSLAWSKFKDTNTREEQILFLIERIKLLNCIQPGQPAGISYNMLQTSISYDSISRDTSIHYYWERKNKFSVINPYSEILRLDLKLDEIKLITPFLKDSSYIPTYTYHRNFFDGRTLYRFNWVIEDLIYQISYRHFLNPEEFLKLDEDQQNLEIKKINDWCDLNSSISTKEFLSNILYSTNEWYEFEKTLSRFIKEDYSGIEDILIKRMNDFKDRGWPSEKGIIAQAMLLKGKSIYTHEVKKWMNTGDDTWTHLFSSLFIIKHSEDDQKTAMDTLKQILNRCDGTSYYPYAIEILLDQKTTESLALAEGILEKWSFLEMFYWDYHSQFIQKLILAKSEKAFLFLQKELLDFSENDNFTSHDKNRNAIDILNCENYISIVEKWKNSKSLYTAEWNKAEKIKYAQTLNDWLTEQFNLIKAGKEHQLIPEKNIGFRYWFVDAP